MNTILKYDEWPSMQDFTFQDFSFKGNKYEMWEAGRLVRSGESNINIHCICNGGVCNSTSIDVILSGNPLPDFLASNIRFDKAICLPDRIMFYSTAVDSNIQHMTLTLLSSNVGFTRESKFYKEKEPIVVSVYTINKSVVKMSFTLANPDRLIEIYEPLHLGQTKLIKKMDMNTKPTKEDIKYLLDKINEIQQSLLYLAMVHPVGKKLGVDKEQYQHLTELKLYLYFAWKIFHNGDINSIIPEKDRKLFEMFLAKAYDKNGNRMPMNDLLIAKIPETIEYVKTDNVLIDCYGSVQTQLLTFMLAIQKYFINHGIINVIRDECTESEKLVIEAFQNYSMGNDGDETYHPLYKAWRSLQKNPEQLKSIQNYGKYGMGFMLFLSYGTVTSIYDQQQLASIAYLFLSKAIKETPSNVNLLKNRLILMISNQESLHYTVSSVVNKKDVDLTWLDSWVDFKFTPRDAMLKMEYADMSKDKRLLSIDMIAKENRSILRYLNDGNFGKNETEHSIILAGEQLHDEVLSYLEQKVIAGGDMEF